MKLRPRRHNLGRQRGFLLNPFRFAVAGGGGGPVDDPYFDKVSLLVKAEGADGATSFTDSSANARTLTTVGDAAISTAAPLYETSSIAASAGGFNSTNYAGLDMGTGDYTIECSFLHTGGSWSNLQFVFDMRGSNANAPCLYYDASYFRLYINDTTQISTTSIPAVGVKHDILISRRFGTTRLYINRTLIGSWAGNDTQNTWVPHFLCSSSNANFLPGKIDEIRITKGVSRGLNAPLPPFSTTQGTNNFTTFSSTLKTSGAVVAGDSLSFSESSTAQEAAMSVAGKSSGKWYWESTSDVSGSYDATQGIRRSDESPSTGFNLGLTCAMRSNGTLYVGSSGATAGTGAAYGSNAILMFALDMDNLKLWVGIDGTWVSGGNPATGANPTFSGFAAGAWHYYAGVDNTTANHTIKGHFGQKGFSYVIPAGFSAGLFN